MTCRACGGDAIGLLEGEPVCGRCAQAYSFAAKMAEERRAFPIVVVPYDGTEQGRQRARETLDDVIRRRLAATYSRGWSRLVEIQRLNEEWLFYARAREAAANGGCRR